MDFILLPTQLFLNQLEDISKESKLLLEKKLALAKLNPYRNKRLHGYNLHLFRIRFEDARKEKRLIYLVEGNTVMLVCIIDRSNDYKDLKGYLRKAGF